MNNNQQLDKILKMHFERIKGVDTKNGLILSANAFVLTGISLLNVLDKKWFITIIIMLSISLFFFVMSITPIF